MKTCLQIIILPALTLGLACAGLAGEPWKARALTPVTFKEALPSPPVTLVKNGRPLAAICVMSNAAGAADLQKHIEVSTGAKLEIVHQKIVTPAIVLGDCPEAAALGLAGAQMPPEGFAIKTASNCVFIVGNVADAREGHGVRWGVNEFLERFVGLRWFFPPETPGGEEIGLDISRTKTLRVPAVWLEDAPVFRLRDMWPPCSDTWGGRSDPHAIADFPQGGKLMAAQGKGSSAELVADRGFERKQPGSIPAQG